jgi:Kelch motif
LHARNTKAAFGAGERNPRKPWVLLALALVGVCARAGTWTPLDRAAPDAVEVMLLLPDGSVMASSGFTEKGLPGGNWFLLRPDAAGSYVHGKWSTLSPMRDSRLWGATAVLPNGKVLAAGGEYGTGFATAELYDPPTDTWTVISPPADLLDPSKVSPPLAANGHPDGQGFYDANSILLPDGRLLIAPAGPAFSGETLLFDWRNTNWSPGPSTMSALLDEASWVRLRDGSVLTVDPESTNSERYIPELGGWVSDAPTPTNLYDRITGEIGPAVLLSDGRAIFFGGSGGTLIYSPGGGTNAGVWAPGPPEPTAPGGGQLLPTDAPAVALVTGKVLCIFSPTPTNDYIYPGPAYFFELDPTTDPSAAFTPVPAPNGGDADEIPGYRALFLSLPDGTLLYSHFGSELFVYTPTGPAAGGRPPEVVRIDLLDGGSFRLFGTSLNGLGAGATYGDDAQMDTSFPVVRLMAGDGTVWFAPTQDWTLPGLGDDTPEHVDFEVPVGLPDGFYTLTVSANGLISAPRAYWSPFRYRVVARAGSGGGTDPAGEIGILPGGTQTFAAISAPGFTNAGWYLDGWRISTNGGPLTLTNVQSEHVVEPAFAPLPPTGNLLVNIEPGGVAAGVGLWALDDGDFEAGGVELDGLDVGVHQVYFANINGWLGPTDRQVTIQTNQTTEIDVKYYRISQDPPTLAAEAGAGAGPLLVLHGAAGNSYVLMTSTDLRAWTAIWTNTVPDAGIITAPLESTNQSKSFYRADRSQ